MADSYLSVGEAAALHLDDEVRPAIVALFTNSELVAADEFHADHYYLAPVGVIVDRLAVLGFSRGDALKAFRDSARAWRAEAPSTPLFGDHVVPQLSDDALTSAVASQVNASRYPRRIADEPFGRMHECLLLRWLVDLSDSSETAVRYVVHESWRHPRDTGCPDFSGHARKRATALPSLTGPTVVLTEGPSDAKLLRLALSVTHPHLVDFVRFFNFESRPAGGVRALRGLLLGLNAAGIANRVVALADNDTAAREGLRDVNKEDLAPNFRVCHYPRLEHLSDYPTLSADGAHAREDVNGRAGALEMYLGVDLLRDRDGQFDPVVWERRPGPHPLQGGLPQRRKAWIQAAFEAKVARHHQGGRSVADDWAGVWAIIETIAHAFDT